MLPWKAIQSEEKTACFISLTAILRAIKLFSCAPVINKDGGFPCNKDEAKQALTHFCSAPRVPQILFDANQVEHGYCGEENVLLVNWAYILDFSASHLAEMRKPCCSHFRFQSAVKQEHLTILFCVNPSLNSSPALLWSCFFVFWVLLCSWVNSFNFQVKWML